MPNTRGKISRIDVSFLAGKLFMTDSNNTRHEFLLWYNDADISPPSVLVLRNWWMSLIQTALSKDLEIEVYHGEESAYVDTLRLYA